MRRTLVFMLLLAMWGALGALLFSRRPVADPQGAESGGGSGSGGLVAEHGLLSGSGEGSGGGLTSAGPERLLDRPLRIVSVDWYPVAPGLVAAGGLSSGEDSAFAAQHIDVAHRVVTDMALVDEALAVGGSAESGADIAVVPLPELVASLERLRALDPQIFLVVGWSRGRDALYASAEDALLELDDDVSLVGQGGEAATFLGLFLLEKAGRAPSDVALIDPDEPDDEAVFAAVDRTALDASRRQGNRELITTTADAAALIPFVAIAPAGFLDQHPDAILAWTLGWLDGVAQMRADVPGAGRQIAQLEDAPETVVLIERLGQIEFADLTENASALGLSGRRATTVESLFGTIWNTWREVGVLTSPTPAGAPLSTETVAGLVRNHPSLLVTGMAAAEQLEPDLSTDTLLRISLPRGDLDEDELISLLGVVAEVFGRSAIRLSIRRARESHLQGYIDRAAERYNLLGARFTIGETRSRAAAVVEVLRAP